MEVNFSSEQQAAYDAYQEAASEATDSATRDAEAQAEFQRAQLEAEHARQASLNAHVRALAAADEFVRSLTDPTVGSTAYVGGVPPDGGE